MPNISRPLPTSFNICETLTILFCNCHLHLTLAIHQHISSLLTSFNSDEYCILHWKSSFSTDGTQINLSAIARFFSHCQFHLTLARHWQNGILLLLTTFNTGKTLKIWYSGAANSCSTSIHWQICCSQLHLTHARHWKTWHSAITSWQTWYSAIANYIILARDNAYNAAILYYILHRQDAEKHGLWPLPTILNTGKALANMVLCHCTLLLTLQTLANIIFYFSQQHITMVKHWQINYFAVANFI